MARQPLIVRVLLASTAAVIAAWLGMAPIMAQQEAAAPVTGLHAPLDALLDLYVRDGFVYYRALQSDRRKLDAYIAALDGPVARGIANGPKDAQIAFWLNAYNGTVLKSVIDNYPINGRASNYPANSLRQVPGVFDKAVHHIAGRALTLDQIETTVIAGYHDPRLYLALGRGAAGSTRLRSEAYAADTLGAALSSVAAEFATGGSQLDINEATGTLSVTSVLSWRQADFVAAYAEGADARYRQRSPLERALMAFITPNLLPHELEFLEKNNFKVQFLPFDWRLNDLNGGRP